MNKKRRVLIVSKDTGHFAGAVTLLEKAGFAVRFVRSNVDVLAEVMTGFPDLIVSELATIGIDGLELSRKLRGMSPWKHLPILLVGDLSTRSPIVVDACVCGADSYMQKPVKGQALYSRCMQLLDVSIAAEACSGPIRAMSADDAMPFRPYNRRVLPFLRRRSPNEELAEGQCWVYRGSDEGAVIIYLSGVDMDAGGFLSYGASPVKATPLIGAADLARSLSQIFLDARQLMIDNGGDGKEATSFSLTE